MIDAELLGFVYHYGLEVNSITVIREWKIPSLFWHSDTPFRVWQGTLSNLVQVLHMIVVVVSMVAW